MSKSLQEIRLCLNIRSRAYPDVQCKSIATNGDYCSRHNKKPIRFIKNAKKVDISLTPKKINAAKIIQHWSRNCITVHRSLRQGPAANCLHVSENKTELYSMDMLNTIPKLYIWSYSDERKHIWCFDIRVFSHLASHGLKNPYTQLPLHVFALEHLEKRLNWLKSKGYSTIFVNDTEITAEQQFNQRLLDVFMKMDFLGYHSATEWFSNLNLEKHINFYRELYDLWNYRLGINTATKEAISPGLNELMKYDPFRFKVQREVRWWKKLNLDCIEALVSRSPEKTNRALGAMYILTALTKVSEEAHDAYSWLD